MDLKVLGCHGGESSKHNCPAFLLDGRVCLDAGSISRMLSLREQQRITTVLVSHAHLDHIRDLAMLADTRTQQGGPPLSIVATPGTLRTLHRHFFNDRVWPDFTKIPANGASTVRFHEVLPGASTQVDGYRVQPIAVDHTIEASAFLVDNGDTALAYSGDTGPTETMWRAIAEQPNLAALIMEVAFPEEQATLARDSGHHTPRSLERELQKLGPERRDLPVLLFHIKPVFQRAVEKELARIKARNNTLLNNGDEYVL